MKPICINLAVAVSYSFIFLEHCQPFDFQATDSNKMRFKFFLVTLLGLDTILRNIAWFEKKQNFHNFPIS